MRLVSQATTIAVALVCSTILIAQESVNNASISGRVTDPTGAAVDGAQVTALQTDTNLSTTAATDNEGRFRIPYLKVGNYDVKISKQGFADSTRTLTLSAGSAARQAFHRHRRSDCKRS